MKEKMAEQIARQLTRDYNGNELDNLILQHLMSKNDFNSLAKALVDEKIAELVPFFQDGEILHFEYIIGDGKFFGYKISISEAFVKITSEEIAKVFDISENIPTTATIRESSSWEKALDAVVKAYRNLPKRSLYFRRGCEFDELEFVSE